ncbi:hypothetical protein CMV_003968 [Castanea mollissima]|uniref:Uncharacterized protein n=1 Tax=Castanea mollissima TaxID=60419 RepID=A0A8J4RRE5_9ROSI|nr:hypothetical protein CMV_003968 [Castanea mollissima]
MVLVFRGSRFDGGGGTGLNQHQRLWSRGFPFLDFLSWHPIRFSFVASHAPLWDSVPPPLLSAHLSTLSTVASVPSSTTVSVEFSTRPSAKVLSSSSHGSRSLSFSISTQIPTLSLRSSVLTISRVLRSCASLRSSKPKSRVRREGPPFDRKRGVEGHGGSVQHWSMIHRSMDCLILSFHEVFSAPKQFQPIRFYFCNQLIGCQERKYVKENNVNLFYIISL